MLGRRLNWKPLHIELLMIERRLLQSHRVRVRILILVIIVFVEWLGGRLVLSLAVAAEAGGASTAADEEDCGRGQGAEEDETAYDAADYGAYVG